MTDRPSQMSEDVTRAMNLLAHPLAGWAAASAVGMGIATQVWGAWFGMVAGAMEHAGRSLKTADRSAAVTDPAAAVRARAAAETIMADAQSLAREVAAVPEDEVEPKASPAPRTKAARPDDLKRLPGIGPKLEQMLNGLGVSKYSHIAGWSDKDVAWIEDQLGLSGRVARDGWVARAAELARPRRK